MTSHSLAYPREPDSPQSEKSSTESNCFYAIPSGMDGTLSIMVKGQLQMGILLVLCSYQNSPIPFIYLQIRLLPKVVGQCDHHLWRQADVVQVYSWASYWIKFPGLKNEGRSCWFLSCKPDTLANIIQKGSIGKLLEGIQIQMEP